MRDQSHITTLPHVYAAPWQQPSAWRDASPAPLGMGAARAQCRLHLIGSTPARGQTRLHHCCRVEAGGASAVSCPRCAPSPLAPVMSSAQGAQRVKRARRKYHARYVPSYHSTHTRGGGESKGRLRHVGMLSVLKVSTLCGCTRRNHFGGKNACNSNQTLDVPLCCPFLKCLPLRECAQQVCLLFRELLKRQRQRLGASDNIWEQDRLHKQVSQSIRSPACTQ